MGRNKMTPDTTPSLDGKYNIRPTTEYRIKQISKAISKGQSRFRTIERYAEEWGISDKQVEKYYTAALESMKFSQGEWDAIKHQNLVRLEKILEDAMAANDRKCAIAVIQEINRMAGVTGGNKVGIQRDEEGKETILIQFD